MSFRVHSPSNITHVRGLYSLDERVPISKFVYEKDRSYLQIYQRKKMANQIRRCCSRSMNVFDPIYYVGMLEYQQIKNRSYSINLENDLRDPSFLKSYSNANSIYERFNRDYNSSLSPTRLKKKKSKANKTRSKSQRNRHSKSFSNSQIIMESPDVYQKNKSTLSIYNDPKFIKEKNLILKKYYKKWYHNWCGKKSMMMSQMRSNH